ncbi:HK97 gp10 family phage protein [Lactococcus lactis]|uniref:HK97 gp10 family phage protein n=1 Tax=Lactococcus lactis TaxID=1358 RepID=UPI00288C7A81|nr:HK97 gp10 family phage protein [Lactococcus lactis]MDT2901497.1 HK97 gp10 family phage protein [Lactococcus lactis]MDT2967977.1 HK97 gp10 family phage protein [Lactococcus lactis]
MAKFGEFDDKQIQEFFKKFKANSHRKDVQDILKKHMTKVGNIVVAETKGNTPVRKINGGTLRDGWKKSTVQISSGSVEIEIYNNVEYSGFVEYGHRVVRGGRTVGYVKGQKMLSNTINDAGSLIDKAAEDAMNEIVNNLFGGL